MKIYKLTPKTKPYFDMGDMGKCSVVYVRATSDQEARLSFPSSYDKLAYGRTVIYLKDDFYESKANCEELSDKEISDLGLSKNGDTEIVLTIKFEE